MSPFRLIALAAVVFLGLSARTEAQFINGNDPFSLYYGYLVPQQAYQASIPKPVDTLRAFSEQNQVRALSERAGLFDTTGQTAAGAYDPLEAFGGFGTTSRTPRTYSMGIANQNLAGTGPPNYFTRHNNYFPTIRTGRSANTSASGRIGSGRRSGGFGGGGRGMGGGLGGGRR